MEQIRRSYIKGLVNLPRRSRPKRPKTFFDFLTALLPNSLGQEESIDKKQKEKYYSQNLPLLLLLSELKAVADILVEVSSRITSRSLGEKD
jgi:hypothetical protein